MAHRLALFALLFGAGTACQGGVEVLPPFPGEPVGAGEFVLGRVSSSTQAAHAWLDPGEPRLFPTAPIPAAEVAAGIFGPEVAWFAGTERSFPQPDRLGSDAPPEHALVPLPDARRSFVLGWAGEQRAWREDPGVFAGLGAAIHAPTLLDCFRAGGSFHRRRGCELTPALRADGGAEDVDPRSDRLCAASGPRCGGSDPGKLEDCKSCLLAETFCERDLGLRACRRDPAEPRRSGAHYVAAGPPCGDGLTPATPACDLAAALATRTDIVLLPGRHVLGPCTLGPCARIDGRRVRISGHGVGTSTIVGWFQVGASERGELTLEDLTLESTDPNGNGVMVFAGRATLERVFAWHASTGAVPDGSPRGIVNAIGADSAVALHGVVLAPRAIGRADERAIKDVEALLVSRGKVEVVDARLFGPISATGASAVLTVRDAVIAPRHGLAGAPLQVAPWAIRVDGGQLSLAEVAIDGGEETLGLTTGGILATNGAAVTVESVLIQRARAGIQLERSRLEGQDLAIEGAVEGSEPGFGLWARSATVALTRVEIDDPVRAGVLVHEASVVELSDAFIDEPRPWQRRSGVGVSTVGSRLGLRRATINDVGARPGDGRPAVAIEVFGGTATLEDVLVKGPNLGSGPRAAWEPLTVLLTEGGHLELVDLEVERAGLVFGVSPTTTLSIGSVEIATAGCLFGSDGGHPWTALLPRLAGLGLERLECAAPLPRDPLPPD